MPAVELRLGQEAMQLDCLVSRKVCHTLGRLRPASAARVTRPTPPRVASVLGDTRRSTRHAVEREESLLSTLVY